MSQLAERLASLEASSAAQPAQPAPSGLSSRLAKLEEEKLKADEKAYDDMIAKRQFDEAEAKKGWLQRKGDELIRGAVRGGEKLAHGVSDLAGDAVEHFAGPEARDNVLLRDKRDRGPSIAPHSSGSMTESVGEWITPLPGVGVAGKAGGKLLAKAIPHAPKLLGRTGQAMAAGAYQGGVYGGVLSEGDNAIDRAKDAALGAATGASTAGVLRAAGSGLATVSDKATETAKRLNDKLGDTRIGGRLTLAKQLGDSPDLGSKLVKSLATKANRGVRAGQARDMDQRVSDDIMQVEFRETFGDIPGAAEKGLKTLGETRNYRTAFNDANKIATKYYNTARPNETARIKQEKFKARSDNMIGNVKRANSTAYNKMEGQNAVKRAELRRAKAAGLRERTKSGALPKDGPEREAYIKRSDKRYNKANAKLKNSLKALGTKNEEQLAALKDKRSSELKLLKREAPRLKPVELDNKRELLQRAINSSTKKRSNAAAGRPSPEGVRLSGNTELADRMSIMRHQGFTPGGERPKDKSDLAATLRTAVPEGMMSAAAIASGNPGIAVGIAAYEVAKNTGKAVGKWRQKRHTKGLGKQPFIPNVDNLPPLPDEPRIAQFLKGDTNLQRQYQQLAAEGDLKDLEQFIAQIAVRAGVDDDG